MTWNQMLLRLGNDNERQRFIALGRELMAEAQHERAVADSPEAATL